MSKKNRDTNKIPRSIKKYITYLFLFSAGFLCAFLFLSYSKNKDTDSALPLRKPTTSKYIAPLLLTGDSVRLSENDSFSKSLKNYVTEETTNGDAVDVSVYFKNLTNGSWIGINENERYTPASLLKVPIMIAVLKQADENPEILQKELYYSENAGDDNTGEYYQPEKHILPGHSYSIETLLEYMIHYSDNNATLLLLSVVPKNDLTEVFTDLGLPVPDDTNNAGTIDYISDKLYSRLFRVLYNSTYLSDENSEKALSLLADIDFPNGMVSKLPKDVIVANKFGERTITTDGVVAYRELHDCGIVYKENNPYLLCIMTKGNDFKKLETIIQNISKTTYDYVK